MNKVLKRLQAIQWANIGSVLVQGALAYAQIMPANKYALAINALIGLFGPSPHIPTLGSVVDFLANTKRVDK